MEDLEQKIKECSLQGFSCCSHMEVKTTLFTLHTWLLFEGDSRVPISKFLRSIQAVAIATNETDYYVGVSGCSILDSNDLVRGYRQACIRAIRNMKRKTNSFSLFDPAELEFKHVAPYIRQFSASVDARHLNDARKRMIREHIEDVFLDSLPEEAPQKSLEERKFEHQCWVDKKAVELREKELENGNFTGKP